MFSAEKRTKLMDYKPIGNNWYFHNEIHLHKRLQNRVLRLPNDEWFIGADVFKQMFNRFLVGCPIDIVFFGLSWKTWKHYYLLELLSFLHITYLCEILFQHTFNQWKNIEMLQTSLPACSQKHIQIVRLD